MEANLRSDRWIGRLWRLRFGAIATRVGRGLSEPDPGPPDSDGDPGQPRSPLVDPDRAGPTNLAGAPHQRSIQLGRGPWHPRRDWVFGANQCRWTVAA